MGACPLKRLILLAAAGLLGLSACTRYGYVKPGVSDAEYAQDSQDCAEIAQHQAFRDFSIIESRSRTRRTFNDRNRITTLDTFALSPGELEFRYRRVCMISRGYELAPLDDQGEAEADGDGQ